MKIKCKKCDGEFTTTKSRISSGKGKFCCKKCYTNYQHSQNISGIKNHNCVICKKEMRLTPYLIRMNTKCCSIKCQHELQKVRVTRICLTCKSEFTVIPSGNKQYCSKKCKEDRFKRELECSQCHKKFIASISIRGRNKLNYFCSNECKFIWGRGKSHPKMSEWMAINIASGNFIPIAQRYAHGYLMNTSSGKNEFYASSYEKIRMEQLNNLGIRWTKNHKIKIKYIDIHGKMRYYIPDILIDQKILEEIKPRRLIHEINNELKFIAGINHCNQNNLEYRILTEKELKIKI